MKYNWPYGIFHWFVHYVVVIALVWSSDFHLVNFIVPWKIFGYTLNANIVDYFIVGIVTTLVDLDHLSVYRKFGKKGIFAFGAERIPLPLHNFFFLALFSAVSAFTALYGMKVISIILFAVVLHMVWDISETAFVFKKSYRIWEKTWGLKSKELEEMWDEMQKGGKR